MPHDLPTTGTPPSKTATAEDVVVIVFRSGLHGDFDPSCLIVLTVLLILILIVLIITLLCAGARTPPSKAATAAATTETPVPTEAVDGPSCLTTPTGCARRTERPTPGRR